MSLTGGFDLALPISANVLNNLIMQQMPSGLPVTGPVSAGPLNLSATVAGKQVDLILYAVLRRLTPQILNVGSTVTLRLSLRYDQASLSGASLPKQICPVAGTLTIDTPISLSSTPIANSTNLLQQAQVDFLATTVTNAFADNTVEAAFPGAGGAISTGLATSLAKLLKLLVPNDGKIGLGPAVPLNPTGGGSLMPLVATNLKLSALNGGLVLFLNVDAATRNTGDVTTKQSLAIPPGSNIALQISAGCFHRQIFCPGLAAQFKVPVASLPTSCGNGSVPYYVAQINESINITGLTDIFQNGRILLKGLLAKSGTCYTFNGDFLGQLTFPSGLTPKFSVIDTHHTLDVPLLCKAVAVLVGALSGGLLFGVITAFGIEIAEKVVNDLITKGFAAGLANLVPNVGGINTGLFNGVSFAKVDVTADGLSLDGYLKTTAFAWTDAASSISLEGAISTTNSTVVEQGTVAKSTPCTAGKKNYPYTLQTIQEMASYDVTLFFAVRPLLQTVWSLLIPNAANTASDVVSIPLGSGTVAIPKIQTTIPNLQGTSTSYQSVTLDYVATPTGVTLTNKEPLKGAYTVHLQATCTLCGGQTTTVQRAISFQGLVLDIVGYDIDVNACSASWYDTIKRAFPGVGQEASPTIFQKVNYPPPEQFTQFYQTMVRYAAAVGADPTDTATMLASGHVQSMVRATLTLNTRGLSVLSGTSAAAIAGTQQTRVEAANLAINTAQAAVDEAQARLDEARTVAADVRTTIAGESR